MAFSCGFSSGAKYRVAKLLLKRKMMKIRVHEAAVLIASVKKKYFLASLGRFSPSEFPILMQAAC